MRLALFSVSYAGLWGQAVLGVCEFIEKAARLGYGGVMLAGKRPHLSPLDATPGQSVAALWPRVVAALRECCDRAAAHGVTVAVQNHHDLAVHTAALLELLADIDRPNCKLGFDAWSPALRGEDLYEAARRAAPHAVLTTNADYVRLPRFQYQPAQVNYQPAAPDLVRAVPFGEGFIDYPAFFRGLRDGGFDGVAAYEMCSPLRGGGAVENLDRCAELYLKWMRENVPATP